MRLESEQMWGYFEWLFQHHALLWGLGIAAGLAVIGFVVCYIVATIMAGPVEGFHAVTRVIYELWLLGYCIWRRFAHAGEPYALAWLIIHPPARVHGAMPGVTNVPLEIVMETESGSRERMNVIRGLVGEACAATKRFYELHLPPPEI